MYDMKILYLLTFTLVAIIVASCGVIEPTADDFFPLRVGDKFSYRLSPESDAPTFSRPEIIEVNVTRKVDTLGKIYYVIENYFAVGTGSEGMIYPRKEGNTIYFFAPNKEILYYRFGSSLDEEYPVPIGITQDGTWPLLPINAFTIRKYESSKNHCVFLVTNLYGFSSYRHYSKFEKGKGRTQVISQGNAGTIKYDLVKVYR